MVYALGDHLSVERGPVWNFDSCEGKIIEMSGKKSCQGKVAKNCLLLAAYLRPYGYLVASYYYSMLIMLCYHYEVFVSYFNH